MVKEYLQKVFERNIEKKIRLEKKRDKYRGLIDEKEKFIILLERAVDTNTEIFTPLDINRDLYEKIEKLRMESSELEETYQELNDDIIEVSLEIEEIREVIHFTNTSNFEDKESLDIMMSFNLLKSKKLYEEFRTINLIDIKKNLQEAHCTYELYSQTAQLERIFMQVFPFDGNDNIVQIIDKIFYDYMMNKQLTFSYSIDGSYNYISNKFGLLFINIMDMLCTFIFNYNSDKVIRLELNISEDNIISNIYFEEVFYVVEEDNEFVILKRLVELLEGKITIKSKLMKVYIPIC